MFSKIPAKIFVPCHGFGTRVSENHGRAQRFSQESLKTLAGHENNQKNHGFMKNAGGLPCNFLQVIVILAQQKSFAATLLPCGRVVDFPFCYDISVY